MNSHFVRICSLTASQEIPLLNRTKQGTKVFENKKKILLKHMNTLKLNKNVFKTGIKLLSFSNVCGSSHAIGVKLCTFDKYINDRFGFTCTSIHKYNVVKRTRAAKDRHTEHWAAYTCKSQNIGTKNGRMWIVWCVRNVSETTIHNTLKT